MEIIDLRKEKVCKLDQNDEESSYPSLTKSHQLEYAIIFLLKIEKFFFLEFGNERLRI